MDQASSKLRQFLEFLNGDAAVIDTLVERFSRVTPGNQEFLLGKLNTFQKLDEILFASPAVPETMKENLRVLQFNVVKTYLHPSTDQSILSVLDEKMTQLNSVLGNRPTQSAQTISSSSNRSGDNSGKSSGKSSNNNSGKSSSNRNGDNSGDTGIVGEKKDEEIDEVIDTLNTTNASSPLDERNSEPLGDIPKSTNPYELAEQLTVRIKDILDKMKTIIAKKESMNARGGAIGGAQEHLNTFKQLVIHLKKYFEVYNTDLMLKIMALLSDKEAYTEFFTLWSGNATDETKRSFTNLLFIDMTTFTNIKKAIQENVKSIQLETMMKRDTFIYNMHAWADTAQQPKPTLLLGWTCIRLLAEITDPTKLLINADYANELVKLIPELSNKVEILQNDHYKNLMAQKSNIDSQYKTLVDRRKRVFTYIKERNDSNPHRNPRYEFKTDDINADKADKSLNITYYNVDGAFSNTPSKASTSVFGSSNSNPGEKDAKSLLEAAMTYGKDTPTQSGNPFAPTSKTTDSSKTNKKGIKETYMFGPFDGVFLASNKEFDTNEKVASNIKGTVMSKLDAGENICMIGYGQSGSGKTSSLIYFRGNGNDGILVEICNSQDFREKYDGIVMTLWNIYAAHGHQDVQSADNIKQEHHNVVPIKLGYVADTDAVAAGSAAFVIGKDSQEVTKWTLNNIKNSDENTEAKKKTLGQVINDAFEMREVEPTPNNPNSSRSHVIVCLALKKINTEFDAANAPKMIICDLAGVENVFTCKPDELLRFDDRYKLSDKYNADKPGSKQVTYDRHACEQFSKPVSKPVPEPKRQMGGAGSWEVEEYNKHMKSLSADINAIALVDQAITYFAKMQPSTDGKNNSLKTEPGTGNITRVKTQSQDYKTLQENLYIPTEVPRSPPNECHAILASQGKDKQPVAISDLKVCPRGLPNEDDQSVVQTSIDTLNKRIQTLLEGFRFFWEIKTDKKDTDNWIKAVSYFKDVQDLWKNNAVRGSTDYAKGMLTQLDTIITLPADLTTTRPSKESIDTIWGPVLLRLITERNRLVDLYCHKHRLQKLEYNCKLRRNEGYVINRSLADMRTDIKSLIQQSLAIDGQGFLPIFWDQPVEPACRNMLMNLNAYDYFYKTPSPSSELSGMILKIMQEKLAVDVSKLNFFVFTVINTTNNGKVNNPPNPPYININTLRYYMAMPTDVTPADLLAELRYVAGFCDQFDFYKSNVQFTSISEDATKNITVEQTTSLVGSLIKLIEGNNPSTLIGSLESTELLKYVNFDTIVCARNPTLEKKLNQLAPYGFEVQEFPTDAVQIGGGAASAARQPANWNMHRKMKYVYHKLRKLM